MLPARGPLRVAIRPTELPLTITLVDYHSHRLLASEVFEPSECIDGKTEDTLMLNLPVDTNSVSPDALVNLHAESGGGPLDGSVRLVPEAKLALIMALQRRLLFGGFPDSAELHRALSLLEASLTHKLFLPDRAAAAVDTSVAGWDSASPDFADMLSRLRQAAGFSGSQSATHMRSSDCESRSPESTERAWREPSDLPSLAALEAATSVIQEELRGVIASGARVPDTQGTDCLDGGVSSRPDGPSWDKADYTAIAPEWGVLHLWKAGEWQAEAEALMPRTIAVLRAEEEAGRLRLNRLQNVACGIARQRGGSGIAPHCDGNVLGLTAHLGLLVPEEGCWIEVGGERRVWEEGRLLLFDTTFTHSTGNDSPNDRYVLMLNVLRPGVSDGDVAALAHVVAAASPRLDILNPFYFWLPELNTSPDVHLAHRRDPAAFAALLPPTSNAHGAAGVEVAPGLWLPMRDGDGNDVDRGIKANGSLVLIVPIAGRRFIVCDGPPSYKTLPDISAAVCASVPAPRLRERVEASVVAVDPTGGIDWVGVPATPASKAMCARAESSDSRTHGDEFSVPVEVLAYHLEVMSRPASAFAWLPLVEEGRVVLEEDVGPASRARPPSSTGFGGRDRRTSRAAGKASSKVGKRRKGR